MSESLPKLDPPISTSSLLKLSERKESATRFAYQVSKKEVPRLWNLQVKLFQEKLRKKLNEEMLDYMAPYQPQMIQNGGFESGYLGHLEDNYMTFGEQDQNKYEEKKPVTTGWLETALANSTPSEQDSFNEFFSIS